MTRTKKYMQYLKNMDPKLGFGVVLALIFISMIDGRGDLEPKFFNVMYYGAIADGKRDNSQAFQRAWIDACHWRGKSRVLIPSGVYMLQSVRFGGPCSGEIKFLIKGILKAPTKPSLFFNDTWIGFRYVHGLTVKGGGYLDGQGAYAWPYNDCFKNPKCLPLPATMRFDFVTNSRIEHIRSINSKASHFNLFACTNITINHVRLSAPQNSPNTDGIRIGVSSNINISQVIIGTGDDCISMVSGSRNIDISGVSCGPGHGISIGSLGKSFEKEYVMDIHVWNSTFVNTQNGVRIKTWAPSLSSMASDITFQDLHMQNVNNPIIIDQDYCPFPPCGTKGKSDSEVQIRNVTFQNIWGTSSSKIAVSLQCSALVPCRDVKLVDINLAYQGPGGPATSSCSNVLGKSHGKQLPPGCL